MTGMIRRTMVFILAVLLLFGVTACGSERPKEEIIEELAVCYGTYGKDASETTDALLKELRAQDPDAAVRWKNILEYWDYANHGIVINYDILPDGLPENEELCIVALGFQLMPDGSMKPELIERLKVVLASAKKYPNACIVCTGGGTAVNDPTATEAGKMAEWLIENGISRERILIEDKSITTAQNAMFSYEILKEQHPEVTSIAIISSDYHIATGALFFESWFILQSEDPDRPVPDVISNAAWKAPTGSLSTMFQAGGLIELSGDKDTAFDIYYGTYDIHSLPSSDE